MFIPVVFNNCSSEKILEVGGKSVSWHSFYLAMKGGGFMDPSVMDVFLKCVDDGLDFLFIPSSLAVRHVYMF
jgi:hypothetical protein